MPERDEGPRGAAPPTAAQGRELAARRIWFGHMSVGFNIVEGVRELAAGAPGGGPTIRETADPGAFSAPVFAHARNGRNGEPLSKLAAFEATLASGVGERVDTAFLKLCFVDIGAGTDVPSLFRAYVEAMRRVRDRHPDLRLVHVTVPLTTVQRGPRAWIKRLLGRVPDGYRENARRGEFNDLLRAEYGGREPVFDLAAAESSPPGGTEEYGYAGRRHRALSPRYTDDGGHLNRAGRLRAARELLAVLAATGGA